MAKISTYALDSVILLDDKLIGTDADNSNVTKNFKVGDLLTFIGTNLNSVPYTGATGNVDLGANDFLAQYIEASSEVYSPLLTGDEVNVFDSLNIKNGSLINLENVPGDVGDLIISQGSLNNPVWITQASFFANAVLTLPTYNSNGDALAGGLVQGQLYKSSTGVVSIVL
jgi:hypothetical protein